MSSLDAWYEEYGLNSRETARVAQLELAREDPRIYSLENDLAMPTVPFHEEFPGRHIQAGIAESNLMGMAAGLAMRGKIPYVNTFATFAVARACEQLRLDLAYNRAGVKVVGYYAGLSGGMAGPTHHSTEDIAITRAIPDLTVLSPADSYEAYRAVKAAARHDGPVYIRATGPPPHEFTGRIMSSPSARRSDCVRAGRSRSSPPAASWWPRPSGRRSCWPRTASNARFTTCIRSSRSTRRR